MVGILRQDTCHMSHIARKVRQALGTVAVAAGLFLAAGCGPVATSLLFDGVPPPPPPEAYCSGWLADKERAARGDVAPVTAPVVKGSVHAPYKEKRCTDCHDTGKQRGLILPPNKLCFSCHDDVVNGSTFVHAPAATGDCLACHRPHDSSFSALLKAEKAEICLTCHGEKRLAGGLHGKVAAAGVVCSDCHDPHAGDNRYFLK